MDTTHTYVVAGANGFLGAAMVRRLARRAEARVIASTRALQEVDADAPRVVYCSHVDLASVEGVEKLATAVRANAQGRVHAINAAGLFAGYHRLLDTDMTEAQAVMSANVLTTIGLAKATLPSMIASGGGHFVAFTSHTDAAAYPLMATFSAAKMAVESLVRSIANEHAKDGIVSNSIALATLNSQDERRLKPFGDHQAWLTEEQVTEYIIELTQSKTRALNGNALHLFNYSPSFFEQSYFDRIKASQDSLTERK